MCKDTVEICSKKLTCVFLFSGMFAGLSTKFFGTVFYVSVFVILSVCAYMHMCVCRYACISMHAYI